MLPSKAPRQISGEQQWGTALSNSRFRDEASGGKGMARIKILIGGEVEGKGMGGEGGCEPRGAAPRGTLRRACSGRAPARAAAAAPAMVQGDQGQPSSPATRHTANALALHAHCTTKTHTPEEHSTQPERGERSALRPAR